MPTEVASDKPVLQPIEPIPAPGFLPYLLKASLWALALYYSASVFATSRFWVVCLSVLLFSLPIALSGIYSSAGSQARKLESFAHRGIIFRWLSGRFLRVSWRVIEAVVMAFLVLLQFHSYRPLEWLLFLAIVPLFWLCFQLTRRIVNKEYKTYLATSTALGSARVLCAAVMVMLSVPVSLYLADPAQYASLGDAITARQTSVQEAAGSALIHEVSSWMSIYWGIKDYALSRLGQLDPLAALAAAGTGSFSFVVFYHAGAMLSSFLISRSEYRRVFGPLSMDSRPAPIPTAGLGIRIAIAVFFCAFVYVPFSAYLEATAQRVSGTWRSQQEQLVVNLERIDNDFFQEGTLAALEQARMEALQRMDLSLVSLQAQSDLAFDQLALHVDDYLDWYYSLGGEYARIGSLLTGELDTFMAARLQEFLMQGEPFAAYEMQLNGLLGEHAQAEQSYREAVARIMQENKVMPPDSGFRIASSISLADALQPPVHQDMIQLQTRLLTSTGSGLLAGGLSALIAQKVIGKVIGKNVFKMAATALGKLVLNKSIGAAAGAGAGASSGAVIGSAVPGIGTLIGATVGGIVGAIAAGLTVDKIIIELEEFVNREEFRQELLAAIEEARVEFNSSLQ